MKYIFTFIILSTIFPLTAFSQVTQKFKITDLEFYGGQLEDDIRLGEMDEIWSRPLGNCMMCTFRGVKDGKVVFYEFIVIEQNVNDSVPVLKLRHFNPGSIGWEDKESPYLYPATFLSNQRVVFERPDKKTPITYERISKKTLKSVLVQEDGATQKTTEFIFSSSEP